MTPTLDLVPMTVAPSYPHMLPAEVAIWTRYIQTGPSDPALVAYDVHVGTPAQTPPDLEEHYARMIGTLSQKRIDVVMFTGPVVLVTEIKPYAGITAVGQALCYSTLFRERFPEYPTVQGAILTDHAQPDTQHLCTLYNIILIEIG